MFGVVVTNSMRNQVISGMQLSDYKQGFRHHNYGCTIDFASENETFSLLITWGEIVDGRRNGVQVWRGSDTYRDVYTNFADRSKTSRGMIVLFNSLYDKVYGDRLQSLHLIDCFDRAMVKNQNKSIREYETTIKDNKLIVLKGNDCNSLLDK